MIHAESLTKSYGSRVAVDAVDFSVAAGRVTGFLGPNGAGKSTTMRMITGLDRPTSGSVTVNGRRYDEHAAPLHEVGVLLDAKAVHPARTARDHLLALAATHRIGAKRVEEVIDLAGLDSVARKRVRGFSLGMGQRLGIAAALLGDPGTLILDEPVNGLDPDGVVWVRDLARALAAEGRTVFLSSHLMSEMSQTADHLIILGRGRILADAPISRILADAAGDTVRVRTGDNDRVGALLAAEGADVTAADTERLAVSGLPAPRIAEVAVAARIAVHEIVRVATSLEEAYMELTRDDVEYVAQNRSEGDR
ncbi:ATP-binding cassette domain-containing protein [Microbacterium sp. NPDC089695]|uniref:ATP-binding cassette domain-containing protein n=1 Tax=Microbacterium sp. NPDC089695 TaxID=3364198 RepID=UPI0037F2AAC3